MAFEVPSHLKKASSTQSPSQPADPSHISTLLAPLLAGNNPESPSRDGLTVAKIQAQRALVQKDVRDTKAEIHKTVVDNYPLLSEQLDSGLKIKSRSKELGERVLELDKELGGEPSSLLPPLISSLKSYSQTTHTHSFATHRKTLLSLLITYRSSFSLLLASPHSVPHYLTCRDLLAREEWSWGATNEAGKHPGGIGPLKRDLEERLRVVRDRMIEELGVMWDGSVRVDWDEGRKSGVITIQQPDSSSLAELADSLSTLESLTPHLQLLSSRLLSQIFTPLLSTPAIPSHPALFSFSQSTSSDSKLSLFRISISPQPNIPPDSSQTQTPTPLPILRSLALFLQAHLPVPLPTLARQLPPLVQNLHLIPSLPNLKPADLPDFERICGEFASWEATIEADGAKDGSRRRVETPLMEFQKGLGGRWVRWRRGDVLSRLRTVLAEEDWSGWIWEQEKIIPGEDVPEPLPEAPAPADVLTVEMLDAPSTGGGEASKQQEEEEEEGWGFDDDAAMPEEEGGSSEFSSPLVISPPSSSSPPRKGTSLPRQPTSETAQPAEEEEEDGWGFEDPPTPPSAPTDLGPTPLVESSPPSLLAPLPPTTSRPTTRSHTRTESIDAWGFDDFNEPSPPLPTAISPASAVSPQPSIPASTSNPLPPLAPATSTFSSAPVPAPRQARRLEKALGRSQKREGSETGGGGSDHGGGSVSGGWSVPSSPAVGGPDSVAGVEGFRIASPVIPQSGSGEISGVEEGLLSPKLSSSVASLGGKAKGGGMKLGGSKKQQQQQAREDLSASISPSIASASSSHDDPWDEASATAQAENARRWAKEEQEKDERKRRREPSVVKERCMVSKKSRVVVEMAEEVRRDIDGLREISLHHSPSFPTSSSSLLLSRTLPDIFTLYRALMPVLHASYLHGTPALAMQFVNDCGWLAEEVVRLGLDGETGSESKLRAMGKSWFDEEIAGQKRSMAEALDDADHFVNTANEKIAQECEDVLGRVVFKMQLLDRIWKPILTTQKCLEALGSILDYVLRSILDDILALSDITAKESTRLNEVCKLVHPLEELFVDQPGSPSTVVAFVPSWLKFCYLSELLEASLADLDYLSESGALIDFTIDELVGLVRALFSDTKLRDQTIDRMRTRSEQATAAQ